MPELPEVEYGRKLVEQHCVGKRITAVTVTEDNKVFDGANPVVLQSALQGRTIVKSCRLGKYLWFELDSEGPWPVVHFGMTGALRVKDVAAAKYIGVKTEDEGSWPPKFCKLILQFDRGPSLAFTDPRRFGRVLLRTDPVHCEPLNKLGFDPLVSMPSLQQFMNLLSSYKSKSLKIKALLLDQSFSAGIGNWVADEVLYQARIHPECPVTQLSEDSITKLHDSIVYVVQTAVSLEADSERFPREWLFHYRWTGKKHSIVNGQKIEFVTVGSRTTAFVPALQKLSGAPNEAGTEPSLAKARVRTAKGTSVKKKQAATASSHEASGTVKEPAEEKRPKASARTGDRARAKRRRQGEVGDKDDGAQLLSRKNTRSRPQAT